MARQKSKKGKGYFLVYKTHNTVYKNKVKKLGRHCKRFPDDEQGKKNLERIIKEGYKGRTRPLIPGSNPTTPKPKFTGIPGYYLVKTAGQQLSELLGIPLPKPKRKFKTIIKHKPKRK